MYEFLIIIVALAFLYLVYGIYKDSKKKHLFFDKNKELEKNDPLSVSKSNLESLKKYREELRSPQKNSKTKCAECLEVTTLPSDSPICTPCISKHRGICICKQCKGVIEKNKDHSCPIDGKTYNSSISEDFFTYSLLSYASNSSYISSVLDNKIVGGFRANSLKNERLLDDATHDFHGEEESYDESPNYEEDSIELDDSDTSSDDDYDE